MGEKRSEGYFCPAVNTDACECTCACLTMSLFRDCPSCLAPLPAPRVITNSLTQGGKAGAGPLAPPPESCHKADAEATQLSHCPQDRHIPPSLQPSFSPKRVNEAALLRHPPDCTLPAVYVSPRGTPLGSSPERAPRTSCLPPSSLMAKIFCWEPWSCRIQGCTVLLEGWEGSPAPRGFTGAFCSGERRAGSGGGSEDRASLGPAPSRCPCCPSPTATGQAPSPLTPTTPNPTCT